jgi:riboflavin kinase
LILKIELTWVNEMDIPALLKIAARGGLEKPVQISSSKLAGDLGTSQQTAARRLKALEDNGHVSRVINPRGQAIRITSKGKELLGGIYHDLSTVFGKDPATFTICGTITTGMGEGEYYMKMEEYTNQFSDKLGFKPFPGTLNLKLKGDEDIRTRHRLSDLPGILIDGFKKESRTFGSVKCFRADFEGIKGAVIIPARTHHSSDTIEVIAPDKIRSKLELDEGDRVCVRLRI